MPRGLWRRSAAIVPVAISEQPGRSSRTASAGPSRRERRKDDRCHRPAWSGSRSAETQPEAVGRAVPSGCGPVLTRVRPAEQDSSLTGDFDRLVSAYRARLSHLEAHLAEGQSDGGIRPVLEPDPAARVVAGAGRLTGHLDDHSEFDHDEQHMDFPLGAGDRRPCSRRRATACRLQTL